MDFEINAKSRLFINLQIVLYYNLEEYQNEKNNCINSHNKSAHSGYRDQKIEIMSSSHEIFQTGSYKFNSVHIQSVPINMRIERRLDSCF